MGSFREFGNFIGTLFLEYSAAGVNHFQHEEIAQSVGINTVVAKQIGNLIPHCGEIYIKLCQRSVEIKYEGIYVAR
jgi:molybdenum cofactor biosynthesis enzyme